MTPYSFAFTIIRVIAILLLSIGVFKPIGFFYAQMLMRQGDYPGGFWFAFNEVALTVLPGLLLYVLAHWLARAAVYAKAAEDRPSNPNICSFCGKSHADMRKLIAGPGVYICNNCVIVCKDLLDKDPKEKLHS
jgi:hypothetical protein